MNKKKKMLFAIGGLSVVLAIVLVAFIANLNNRNSQPEQGYNKEPQTNQSESAGDEAGSSPEEQVTESKPADDPTSIQTTKQPSSTSTQNDSDTPLCSRQNLSYTDAQYCAEQLRQQREEEDRRRIEEARVAWCTENVPRIYNEYNARLISENDRYTREVGSYISSYVATGGPGGEAVARELAEKQYGPQHTQNVNFIVANYMSAVRGHGCDLSSYSM